MSSQFEDLGERIRDFVQPYLAGVPEQYGERSRELKLAHPIGFLLVDTIVVRESPLCKEEQEERFCGLDVVEWGIDFQSPLLGDYAVHGIAADSLLLEPSIKIHDPDITTDLEYDEDILDREHVNAQIAEILDQVETLQAHGYLTPV